LKISSADFNANDRIPVAYTCDGDNINPSLEVSGVSVKTQSLVLIMDDIDAPEGIFTHWMVWNIDPAVKEIEEGVIPVGTAQGLNDSGRVGYTGPCPSSGLHHYHFRLYALDKKLALPEPVTRDELDEAMANHILEEDDLVGVYSREEI